MEVKFSTPKKPVFNFDVSELEKNERELLKKQERKINGALISAVATAMLTGAFRLARKYKKAKGKK